MSPPRGSSGHNPTAPVPRRKGGQDVQVQTGGTREVWGGGGTLSCSGVLHKAPLQPSPSAASPLRSAGTIPQPSGNSPAVPALGPPGTGKTSPDPGGRWGAAMASSIPAAGRGPVQQGMWGQRGIWGSGGSGAAGNLGQRGWGCTCPSPLPARFSRLPCPHSDGPCLPSLLICTKWDCR